MLSFDISGLVLEMQDEPELNARVGHGDLDAVLVSATDRTL